MACTGVTRLGSERGLALGHEADVLIDRLGLGVSGAFGGDDLLLGQANQQLVGVLGVPKSDQICGIDFVQNTRPRYSLSGSEESESCSRDSSVFSSAGALALIWPMVPMASRFAPSVSSTVPYVVFTRSC